MSYTPNSYTTTGTETTFAITFPFLKEADVVVTVFDPSGNTVSAFDYEIFLDGSFKARVVADGTITDNAPTPLTSGHTVTISRATDIATLATTFQDGVSLRADDINLLLNQQNFALQEFGRNTEEALGKNVNDTAWDATSLRITNLAQPTADNDAVRKIDVDSGIGPNITTVAGIAANVTSVANDATDIGVLATDISGTNTIGTVSTNIASVQNVSGSIANVNAVAADATDIGVVAADIQNGGPDTIGTVATAISNVAIVAGINGPIQTVSTNIADVTAVANDATDIGVVAADISGANNIGTVASNISDVNTLAPQATNISTLTQAANLTALQNAATNAAAAEAALNAFNATYVGAYASDPTVDANGNALTDGDLYYDTTTLRLKFYDAANSTWITLANSVQVNAAATLQGVSDVDFANSGGPNLTLAANHFIVRDATNTRWENTNAAGVRSLLNVEDGATADQTGAEIKTALFNEADTNNLTDTLLGDLQNAPTISDATNRGHVEAINQGLATTSTPTFAGADFGSNAITYSNLYATTGDLPSASTYHGMFAHVHATGKGYFAHAGNWVELANQTDVDDRASKGFAVAMSIVF